MFGMYSLVIWFGSLELSSCRATYEQFLVSFLAVLMAAMGLSQSQVRTCMPYRQRTARVTSATMQLHQHMAMECCLRLASKAIVEAVVRCMRRPADACLLPVVHVVCMLAPSASRASHARLLCELCPPPPASQLSFPDLGKAKSAVQRVFPISESHPVMDVPAPESRVVRAAADSLFVDCPADQKPGC
jgi:hypothetical protein